MLNKNSQLWKKTSKAGMASMLLLGLFACSPAEEKNVLPPLDEEKENIEKIILPDARSDNLNDRFAKLALDCIHRPYPNKLSHVLNKSEDAQPPQALTPAFYGCFDWHSAVHGHWLIARITKTDMDSPFQDIITDSLAKSFTADNLMAETAYVEAPGRHSFERPYGIAWLFQLIAELHESNNPQHQEWRERFRPLEALRLEQVKQWLPKLAYPVRLGTHNQSAFAFGLMYDYAIAVGDAGLEKMIVSRSQDFFLKDVDCPLSYEPSGEDFLSPCLMEADLMRRIMLPEQFSDWLTAFLPTIPQEADEEWLKPAIVLDASDGKLVHLTGLNLSRAWAMEGILSALAHDDPRRAALKVAIETHRKAGIDAISETHYSGSHWLGSFATYLETKRGLPVKAIHPRVPTENIENSQSRP